MNNLLVDDVSIEVVVNDPAITGSQEQGLVIGIPKSSGCNFVRFGLISKYYFEVSQSWDFLDGFVICDIVVEDGLEIEDFYP